METGDGGADENYDDHGKDKGNEQVCTQLQQQPQQQEGEGMDVAGGQGQQAQPDQLPSGEENVSVLNPSDMEGGEKAFDEEELNKPPADNKVEKSSDNDVGEKSRDKDNGDVDGSLGVQDSEVKVGDDEKEDRNNAGLNDEEDVVTKQGEDNRQKVSEKDKDKGEPEKSEIHPSNPVALAGEDQPVSLPVTHMETGNVMTGNDENNRNSESSTGVSVEGSVDTVVPLGETDDEGERQERRNSVCKEESQDGNDGGGDDMAKLGTKDADGTTEESKSGDGQASNETEKFGDNSGHNPAQGEVTDADIDDFFNPVRPVGNVKARGQGGQFPALDNVDFETDEEGQEMERDAGKQGAETVEGDDGGSYLGSDGQKESRDGSIRDEEETGQKDSAEGARSRMGDRGFEEDEDANEVVLDAATYMSSDGDQGDGIISMEGGVGSSRKDYPLNYQNYKVCREVTPGIKECLILETGEQFVYISRPKPKTTESTDSGGGAESNQRSVFVIPQNFKSQNKNGDFSGERRSSVEGGNEDADRGDGQGRDQGQVQHLSSGKSSVISRSEAFAYASFDDTTGRSDPQAPSTRLEGNQQAYITENGIPIILDNAEDDVKAEQQAEIDRLRMGTQPLGTGSKALEAGDHGDGTPLGDVVEDVLSSGSEGEREPQRLHKEHPAVIKQSKRKKEKKDKFYELQPDIGADSAEDTATMSESDAVTDNVNNNYNEDGEEEGREGREDANNNTNDRLRDGYSSYHREKERSGREAYDRPSHYSSDRSHQANSSDYSHSYNRYSSGTGGLGLSGSRSHVHSSRGDSYLDSRGYRSRDDTSYSYRSGEPSSVDSSRLSTRYTYIERGDPRTASSKPESVTVPKFKTLHDQQVSWLDMFKMIEKQHRSELQSQYLEHQKILQDMQKNMEKELNKQQDTLKQRLTSHREILQELSPGRHKKSPGVQNVNQSRTYEEADDSSAGSQGPSVEFLTNSSTSHTTLQGVPVSLKNPPPLSRYQQDVYDHKSSEDLPVKRSLEKELSSPTRPADTSLNLSRISVGGDKQLRGGVYSSPMPLAKVKHKHSPRGSKSYDDTHRTSPRQEASHNSNSVHWSGDSHGRQDERHTRQGQGSADVSLAESDDVLSPRTRINLREKHAKHLADLRAYYEEELREMRQVLSSRQGTGDGVGVTVSTGEKLLAEENHELRQKCQQLQDAYHDGKIEIREMQQKIQGLEIRAADYAERYEAAQAQVLSLRSRLEELTGFAKEKESLAGDLESKNKKNVDALQMAYKREKELTESLHSAKTTIQRLVDKYETLEKDHCLLKESAATTQEKFYSSRSEVMDANNKLSRLELENKQLKHDNDVLKHELTMARSATTNRTSYEDAYHHDRGRSAVSTYNNTRTKSMDRTYRSPSHERRVFAKESSPDSEADSDYQRSPIIRAERELKKLQQTVGSQDFAPKLQKKFYGTEISGYGGPSQSTNHTNNHTTPTKVSKSLSPRDKKVRTTPNSRDHSSRATAPSSSSFSRTPVKEDREATRSSREADRIIESRTFKERDHRERELKERVYNSPSKKSSTVENGLSSEQAIQRIKSGEVVSRPAWEDVYTSLASGRPGTGGEKSSAANSTRDQMIRERLQNISNLERKYDDLCEEKRKYESALSKLPSHGQRGEKDRLDTELDRVDRELGSIRMSLKRFHVLKSTI